MLEGFKIYNKYTNPEKVGIGDPIVCRDDKPTTYAIAYTLHKLTFRPLKLRRADNGFNIVIEHYANKFPFIEISSNCSIEWLSILIRKLRSMGCNIAFSRRLHVDLHLGFSTGALRNISILELLGNVLRYQLRTKENSCEKCGALTYNEHLCDSCLSHYSRSALRRYGESLDITELDNERTYIRECSLKYMLGLEPIGDIIRRYKRRYGRTCLICGDRLFYYYSRMDDMLCDSCFNKYSTFRIRTLLENGIAKPEELHDYLDIIRREDE